VEGGYFRAMITSLDPFDRVAGGLAWSITAASENVNLSLLFEEHSRMGEKVEMSENIELALTSMKCPHVIQAQQILHLDCINIFPVVQWLVNHLVEVRKATGDLVRIYSERQFTKFDYKISSEVVPKKEIPALPKRVQKMKKSRYLRSSRRGQEFEEERVHTVLLEFGQGHLYTLALFQKKKR